MDFPKVSVIIPIYNPGNYLIKCLDSVINQTLSEIEVICVDDGSTDSSFDILKDYANKDSRFKIFHQENFYYIQLRLYLNLTPFFHFLNLLKLYIHQ